MLGTALMSLIRGRDPMAMIFQKPQRIYYREFKVALQDLGLNSLHLTLYSLRHGGATHHKEILNRELSEIKKKGRWRSDRNVARYEKAGRLALTLARAPAKVLEYGRKAEANLPEMLLGLWRPAPYSPL